MAGDLMALTGVAKGLELVRIATGEALPAPTLGPTLTPWPTRITGAQPPVVTPLPTAHPRTTTPLPTPAAPEDGAYRLYLPAARAMGSL